MSEETVTYIDGNGIEWNGIFAGGISLKACHGNEAGADLIEVFSDKLHQAISFAVQFPEQNGRQETRIARGILTNFERDSESITVRVRTEEPPTIQITRRRL